LQRLFSTFAEGWPGAGLLLQRLLISAIILFYGILHLVEPASLTTRLPFLIASAAAAFLFLGLWTPVAGTIISIVGIWIFFAVCPGHSLTAIIVAVIGATVAMIGPGMWSIDARLYGRKHLQAPRTRQRSILQKY
jgi:putative oxidoreductase